MIIRRVCGGAQGVTSVEHQNARQYRGHHTQQADSTAGPCKTSSGEPVEGKDGIMRLTLDPIGHAGKVANGRLQAVPSTLECGRLSNPPLRRRLRSCTSAAWRESPDRTDGGRASSACSVWRAAGITGTERGGLLPCGAPSCRRSSPSRPAPCSVTRQPGFPPLQRGHPGP